MKLMFYINTISYGGAERVIVNLANQFDNKGYDVIFVTTYRSEKEYELNQSIKREVLLENTQYKFLKKNIKCTRSLRKLLKSEKPEVLISFMAEPNFRSVVACWGLKTGNLISVRNDPDREYPNAIFRFCAKFLYRFADCTVFQTQEAQNWFSDSIQKKSCIIFNQVNEQFFKAIPSDIHEGIVTVGRLTAQKNHEMLIRAFSEIADRTSENLIIYGEGECRNALTKLAEEKSLSHRIFFPGTISDVANVIKSAKIFVLSSNYEGMPNALLEAMALGLPCISTDCPCGGPRELFEGQKNGVLVDVDNDSQMAEKMIYLLENETERREISLNASNYAKRFSPEIIFGQWESCVIQIIGK